MNLNDEIMKKGPSTVESEITTEIRVYKYVTIISLFACLVFCRWYNIETELSRAKSYQLLQRDATIIEKCDQIKLLEELNINLSKTK